MSPTHLSRQPAPEVGTLDPQRLERLRQLGHLLDNSIPIPGTRFRVGLDAIIGLVPGVGDLVGGALSLYIVMQAARLGVPRPLLARMGWNVAVETVVGAIPLFGDLFDAGYKANLRNLALIQQQVDQPVKSKRASVRFAALLAVGLLLLLAGAVALGVVLVRLLSQPVL
ncbi:MAG: DUF4112 domain-containing protein [Gemmatimonadales bacterium]